MRQGEVLGVERRRRWSDEEKLAILERVGVGGRTVADVAREEDLTRQHRKRPIVTACRMSACWPKTRA